jgi:hydroxymethylglutaryl-CoA reductase
MNGIDPVIIATGNDWRAIEAGAHAYAARDGRFYFFPMLTQTPLLHHGLPLPLSRICRV